MRKFDDFNDRHGRDNAHRHNDNYYFNEETIGKKHCGKYCEDLEPEASAVEGLEWELKTGKEVGYDTGDNPTAVLDFGIAILTLSYAPYKDSRNEEYFAELDFEGGFYEVAEEPDPWKAIRVVLKNYIDPDTIPDIPEDILEALYQEAL